MENFTLILFILFFISFVVGLVWLIISFLKKAPKKKSLIALGISLVSFILMLVTIQVEASNQAKESKKIEYTDDSTYDPSVYDDSIDENSTEVSSTEISSSESSKPAGSNFEDFINTKPDFSAFVDEYYKYEADGKASKVRNYLTDAPITWTGTVIETMHTRIAIIANDKYNQTNWTNLSDDLRPYVFFAKNIDQNQVSQFAVGDHVTVTGKIISGGSKLANAQWDVDTETITK